MTDQYDTTSDVHSLSGAYTVDALEPDEQARFEEHLRGCPACAEEVASLREATAALASDADSQPPPALRESILAGIQAVRPLPPLVTPEPAKVVPIRRRRFLGLPGAHLVLAAAVLAVIAAAGATWWQLAPEDQPTLTAAERVLTAPDAVRATEQFPGGATATVVVSRSQGKGVVVTEDMEPAPEGKVYQLWLQTPAGDLVPAGLMPDEPDTTYVLEEDASQATGVGISVEPDGGSEQPSTEPIAFFEIDS